MRVAPAAGPSVPRRTAVLLTGRIASAGTTVLVLAVVGQARGAAELGAVALGLATGAIAAALSDLGAITLLVREVARTPGRSGPLLAGLTLLRVPTLAVALLATSLVALGAGPSAFATVLLVATGLAVQSFAELTRAVFMAQQRFTIPASHFVVENVVWAFVVASLLLLAPDLPTAWVFAAGLAVFVVSVAVGYGLVYAVGGAAGGLPSRAEVRHLARSAPPFAAFAVIGTMYSRLDTVLIGMLMPGGVAVAGSYFAASRVIVALEYVPEAAARGVFPELARRFSTAPREVAPLLGRVARGLLVIGAGVPAVLVPSGDVVLPALFATPPETAWVLGALSLVVPLRYLGYLFGVSLTSADAQGLRVAAGSVALVGVVAINVLGIGPFGLIAPVASALFAALVVGTLYAVFVRRQFGATGLSATLVLGLAACSALGAGAGFAVRMAIPGDVGAVPAAVVALVTYAALAALGPARPIIRGIVAPQNSLP